MIATMEAGPNAIIGLGFFGGRSRGFDFVAPDASVGPRRAKARKAPGVGLSIRF